MLHSDRRALLRAGVEVALVLLLAAQAARLAWLLVAPPGPVGNWPPADAGRARGPAPALALAFDPFHPGARSGPVTANATGYRLHATRVAGTSGSAILSIGSGGPQAAFQVGDEVEPGVALVNVGAGHAVLRTGSGDQRVELESAASTLPPRAGPAAASLPSAAPSATQAQGAAIDPAALLAQAGLRARTEGGRVTGYTLIPRGGGELLRQAGLQAGDVLVAVDGNQLNPERLAELESELAGRDEVRLTVQRDGQPRTLTLRTTSP
ncbi:MAG: PDZ domain-containing protein, partial [Gammaproteobacteria bacterium]|nr:PDZ domain-containing protein [Gammaproteobacteria bacterium]